MKYNIEQILSLFQLPLFELIEQSREVYKNNFSDNDFQISNIISVKTGRCPENCRYCSQSAHYKTDTKYEYILDNYSYIIQQAQIAQKNGAKRICLSGAWRKPRDTEVEKIASIVQKIKAIGLETCCTLGTINKHQAEILKNAGLDFYNHNIDTSEKFYKNVVTTRTFQERLNTIEIVSTAGIKVCSGLILGMGESLQDRAEALEVLQKIQPLSCPINILVKIPGTPMAEIESSISDIELVRVVSVARILMPKSYVRLSAGREKRSEGCQMLCIFAGANSFFLGEKLLTVKNNEPTKDMQMLNEILN